jgi:protease I
MRIIRDFVSRPGSCLLASASLLVAGAALMVSPTPAHASEAAAPLAGKHILFLVGEGVHDGETFMPMAYLVNRGAQVSIAGVAPGEVAAYNSDYRVTVEKSVAELAVDDFDAMVIPGGRSPAWLREHDTVVGFAREFFATGKPVAAICHGPQVLITAGVLQGLRTTGVAGISEELAQAGAVYLDEAVVRDGNLITSRLPKDLPAFSRAIELSLLDTGAATQ